MRAQIEAIINELKHLKAEGVADIYVETASLVQLKAAAQELAGASSVVLPVTEPDQHRPKPAPAEQPFIDISQPAVMPAKSEKKSKKNQKYVTAPIPEPPAITLPEGDKASQWAWLQKRVLDCPVCNAHVRTERGKKVVFGVGNLNADIFFCGEAPGAEEEMQGEPFVGPAGQLLTKIIKAMGLAREDVYIGNIMNWRPEMPTEYGNRKPYPEEMAFCLPYLQAQLEIVRPKVIVALGATAVDGLLGVDPKRRMGQVRGQWQAFAGRPLMITFHPSYLLRNNTLRTKRMVWEDMLLVMEKLVMPISDKQRSYFLQ